MSSCLRMGDDVCLIDVRYDSSLSILAHPCRFDGFLALFCVTGSIRVMINLREFEVKENSMFLYMPGNIMSVCDVDEASVDSLHFVVIAMTKEYMEGLDVEPNPLDREYEGREPAVLHADSSIIVVDKPAGMLSVPGRNGIGSLLDWLAERYGEVHSCHRLDMDTSGIMVYARNIPCKAALEAQFAGREVSKTYRARLSAGSTPFRRSASGTIALPLSPDYYDRPRQIVDKSSGKPAISEYKVLEMLPDGEIDIVFHPLTGRTHQLRVHAAHPSGLGRPIKGDLLYGGTPADRLYLHAESLGFTHPTSGEKLTFRTE